jgi:hypothetical protein
MKEPDLFKSGSCVEQFDAAIGTVTQERGDTYGSPLTNFSRISVMQSCVADCGHPAVRHALEMIMVKVARIVVSPEAENMDSVIDIAGYARTIAMVLDEEELDEES